jgi:hypothetical protein
MPGNAKAHLDIEESVAWWLGNQVATSSTSAAAKLASNKRMLVRHRGGLQSRHNGHATTMVKRTHVRTARGSRQA